MGTVTVLRPQRLASRRRVIMDPEQANACLAGAASIDKLVALARNGNPEANRQMRQHAKELRTLAQQFFLSDDRGVVS